MTSLYRDLNTAALEANLNKTQLAVFLALSTQTLGYGKVHDPLTDNRIAKMTGIRVDRVRPAIRAIIKKGIFDRCKHHQFDYEYYIGEKFLEAHQGKVYTPFIPKKRSDTEKENPISGNGANQPENEEHTVIQPTKSNLQQQTNTKKTKFSPQQQTNTETKKITKSNPQQQTQSVKILFTDTEQGQHPPSFAIETTMANTRVEVSFDQQKATTQPTPSVTTDTEALTTPETIAALKKLLAIQNTDKPTIDDHQTATTEPEPIPTPAEPVMTMPISEPEPEPEPESLPTDEEPLVVCDVEEEIVFVDKEPAQSPLSLPKAIIAEDVHACNQPFKILSREQQEKVLQVFNYNMKTRTINNTTGYFITLAKSAIEGGLTVPREALVDTPKHQQAQAKIKAKQDEQLRRIELWSEYTWLQSHAERENMAMEVLAKQMGEKTEAAYAMYGQVQ